MLFQGRAFELIVEAPAAADAYITRLVTSDGVLEADLGVDPGVVLRSSGPLWSPVPIPVDHPIPVVTADQVAVAPAILPQGFIWRRAAASNEIDVGKSRWDQNAARAGRDMATAFAFLAGLDIVLRGFVAQAAERGAGSDADRADHVRNAADDDTAAGGGILAHVDDASGAEQDNTSVHALSSTIAGDLAHEGSGAEDERAVAPDESGGAAFVRKLFSQDGQGDASTAGTEVLETGLDGLLIQGTDGDDVLIGGDGNDTIYGGDGNDLLDGRAGSDLMIGGDGDDVYAVDSIGDVVVEQADEGVDTVEVAIASYTLGDNVENLSATYISDFEGTGNDLDNTIIGNIGDDLLSGGAGADVLVGNDGSDRLDGGTEADHMAGGRGDDTYVVDHIADAVLEAVDEGIDTVETSTASYTLGDNVENLIATSDADFLGIGNDLDNTLHGNTGDDRLLGGAGDDVLDGNAGDDELHGGAGRDHLSGGRGNDYLDGGTQADVMAGGRGDDTYIVDDKDDVVIEAADAGNDRIIVLTASVGEFDLTTTAAVETLIATGSADFRGIGNDLDNLIIGSEEGRNSLDGGAGSDDLRGGNCDDRLDGGSGADTMAGGLGNDTYVVDDLADAILEAIDEGHDTVETSLGEYTLAEALEDLIYSGGTDFVGVGNIGSNTIIAGDGDDLLFGDQDSYTSWSADQDGDRQRDRGRDDDGDGSNAEAALNILLGDQADIILVSNEVAAAAGGASDLLLGSKKDDTIVGFQAGNDSIFAGAGDDTIDGGTGDDWLTGGSGDDVFIFRPGFGNDVITDFGTSGGNTDIIRIVGDRFVSYDDLESHMEQVGTDVVITVSADERIVLANVDKMTLAIEDQFIF